MKIFQKIFGTFLSTTIYFFISMAIINKYPNAGTLIFTISFVSFIVAISKAIIRLYKKHIRKEIFDKADKTKTFNPLDHIKKHTQTKQIKDNIKTDYVVIDIETTGVFSRDRLTEIALVKIKDGNIVDTYSTLINPEIDIPYFIQIKTNITNEMVATAPVIEDIKDDIISFIGDNILLGYNIKTFDIPFLSRVLNHKFNNEIIDVLYMAKNKMDLMSYRLDNVSALLKIENKNYHRALNDCLVAHECYKLLLAYKGDKILDKFKFERNEEHPLFGKTVVCTGTPSRMSKSNLEKVLTSLGAHFRQNISKKTDYLIICEDKGMVKEDISTKERKAYEYIELGIPIEIIDEHTFYKMLE